MQMLLEATIDGVDIILNDHIYERPFTAFSEGRYITRAELAEIYPRIVCEHFFDEADRTDEFKSWEDLGPHSKRAVFLFVACEDPDYVLLDRELPNMLKG